MLADIEILGLSIKTFGLFFGLNFVAWGALAGRRLQELGKPVDWAYEMVFVALGGGLVGAKLYFVLEQGSALELGDVFSGAGLTWYGGLLGGVVGMLAWARYRGFLSWHLVDIAGPCLALGYAIGRIGCQISGDGDYGVASGLPWAMPYPDGVVPIETAVHPTPMYETLTMGLVALALWRMRDLFRPGALFAFYLVLAGLERFLVEFVRRNDEVLAGLTGAQSWALVSIALGIAWLAVAQTRGGLRAPRPAGAAA